MLQPSPLLPATVFRIAILLAIVIVFVPNLSIHAQSTDVHPNVLIPYNDHGQWGYCDTLGNIQIKPQYEAARFFYAKTINEEETHLSTVYTKHGSALLKSNGNLLLPKKAYRVKNLSTSAAPKGTVYLAQRKGKYGIYQLDEGWLVKPQFDSLYPRSYHNWTLFKSDKDATFSRFNLETLQLESTEIVEVKEHWGDLGTVNIVTTRDGQKHLLTKNGMVQMTTDELEQYEDLDGVFLEEVPYDTILEDDDTFRWRGTAVTTQQLGVARNENMKDYSTLSYAGRYGFSKAIIASKDGQMGMVNENGEVILPFAYDRIRFTASATSAFLEKDGKFGYKILFTHHPVIEARYESIVLDRQLPVSNNWRFALFLVEVNGQKGYVGENAVEYFDLE